MSASNAVLRRMKLTLHATRPTPHGAFLLVQSASAWSVKTRRVPFRHCKEARVYGAYNTTTAIHDITVVPFPPPYVCLSSFCSYVLKRWFSPHPCILLCDVNSVPCSPFYHCTVHTWYTSTLSPVRECSLLTGL